MSTLSTTGSKHLKPMQMKFMQICNALIKMFMSSKKLFVRHLPGRIVGMESAEKGAANYRKKSIRDWLEKTNQKASLVQHSIFKQHVSKSIGICSSFQKRMRLPVGANLPPSQIPSFLLLIHSLNFIFHKILLMLNIMTTVDSLFLPKSALLSILKPLSSNLLTPSSVDKKFLFVFRILH